MKILKIKKGKENTYQIVFEGETLTVTDDLLIEYQLLLHKDISKNEYNELKKEVEFSRIFSQCLKYISRKMRSEKEVRIFLINKGIEPLEVRNKIIWKLKDLHYLDEDRYLDSFLHDTCAFSFDGPKKIQKKLEDLGLPSDKINEKLEKIDPLVWEEKIKQIIKKRVASNHSDSPQRCKQKLEQYLLSNGYLRSQFASFLATVAVPKDPNLIQKEYDKLNKRLSRKYSGKELNWQIKKRLYSLGFSKEEIDSVS